jgi:protein-tyrosine phosphatase
MPTQDKPSVLFVCTANRFRSPIVEAAFRKLLQERGIENNWIVGSAGSWTKDGLPPIPSAAWMLEHFGLDLSMHHSRSVSRKLLAQYHLVLVMEKNQKEALQIEFPEFSHKVFMLTEVCNGPVYDIPDPVAQSEEMCLSVAQEIIHLIENCFQEICLRASTCIKSSDDR